MRFVPSLQSGYDNNFVETPPNELKCLICHDVARDPQQISCCGKVYCKDCLTECETCPTCRKRSSSFADLVSSKRIQSLKVTCDNENAGCAWSGKLGDLDDHLSVCEMAKVICTKGCWISVCRRDLEQHLNSECSQRLHKCPHCHKEDAYSNIMTIHQTECPMVEISCPNEGCEFQNKRVVVGFHQASCPKERVQCEYSEAGCDMEVTRDALEEHTTQCIKQHLKLAMNKVAAQQSIFQIPPRVFKMPHFQQHKSSNTTWESPAFYSHPGGYKMVISVRVVSGSRHMFWVYAHLVLGENDHNLVWPFQGVVTIELLNQETNNGHIHTQINYENEEEDYYNKRPQNCPRNKTERKGEIIVSSIHCIKDDCLYFRVSNVTVRDSNKPWLTPTDT